MRSFRLPSMRMRIRGSLHRRHSSFFGSVGVKPAQLLVITPQRCPRDRPFQPGHQARAQHRRPQGELGADHGQPDPAEHVEVGVGQPQGLEPAALPVQDTLHAEALHEAAQLPLRGGALLQVHEVGGDAALGEEADDHVGPAAGGGSRFLLFHRKRLWNEAQHTWMGWERKRGKLHELNQLLRGSTTTTFLAVGGHSPESIPSVRYVITLDADTRLPRGAAHRLIGTMAHPLNRPRFDRLAGREDEAWREVEMLAEIGVIFLLFVIGVEFSFKHLVSIRGNRNAAYTSQFPQKLWGKGRL